MLILKRYWMDGVLVQEELGESQWERALKIQSGSDYYETLWRSEIWLTDYPVAGKCLPKEMILVHSWEKPISRWFRWIPRFLTWIHN